MPLGKSAPRNDKYGLYRGYAKVSFKGRLGGVVLKIETTSPSPSLVRRDLKRLNPFLKH